MMKRILLYFCVLLSAFVLGTSCTDQDFFQSDDELVQVTYTVGLGQDVQGRAIGDGSQVDVLYVGIYENGQEVKRESFNVQDRKATVKLALFKGHTYDLAFWAQNSQTNVYDRTDLRNVTVTYPESMTLQEAAAMDAFSGSQPEVTTETGGGPLDLKRPFALFSVGASEEDATLTVQKVVLTAAYSETDVVTLTFTDFQVEDGDQITDKNGVNYSYLATAFLKPGEADVTVVLLGENDTEIKRVSNELTLTANYRYNLIGEMITQEVLPGWDGTIPENHTLTTDNENRYVLDEEADLAWLSVENNASTLKENSTFIVTKDVLDMGNHKIASISLPAGSTFDGNSKTIKNYANSLFDNATDLTVQNLVLDNVVATSEGHVGVLVNTLKGNGTFTNVSVSNSSATTTNGAAGGMVGYIVRQSEKNRSETLNVNFKNCDLVNVKANGTQSEGKFVGLLSGYDKGETLSFDADCSVDANTNVTDYTSPYQEGSEGKWLSSTDYSNYNAFLGDEAYYRGNVMYGDKRFVPCWTGRKDIEPLDANETLDGVATGKVIYSSTDMAYFSGKSYSEKNVYLRSDIDMGGKVGDGLAFTPIISMKYLDGLKKGVSTYSSFEDCHTIYNLKAVFTHKDADGAAFIHVGGNDIHQNLVFDGAYIDSKHDATITDINHSDYGNAYAGTLVSRVSGNYKVTNIMIKNGTISGVCKMGGLLGACWGNLQAKNCNVDNCTIKNYDPQCINWYYQKEEVGSLIAYAKDSFYTDGECGGLIGFISACSPTITDCSVTNTTLDCTGEADKPVSIGVYSADSFNENNLPDAKVKGKVTIAGRHVNQFIGDIRTTEANNTITIVNPFIEGNKYLRDENNCLFNETETKTKTKEEIKKNDIHFVGEVVTGRYRTYTCVKDYSYTSLVGCAYVVAVTVEVLGKHVGDERGVITITNSRLAFSSEKRTEVTTGTEYSYSGVAPDVWDCTYNWTYNTIYNPTGESTFTRFVGDDFSL